MAEKGSLTEKTGVVVFARIVNTVVELGIVVAVLQLLSKSDFAVIGYLLMVHEIVRNLATLGFPESIFYYFERITRNARKAFVFQTCAILSLMALLAGAVILGIAALAPELLAQWDRASVDSVQYLLPLMALVTVLEVPVWPTTNVLLAADRQRQASWYEMLTTLLNFICLVGPLLLGYSLTIAVYGLVLYAVVRFVGSVLWLSLTLPGRTRDETGVAVADQLRFSIPLGTSAMISKVNRYVDKLVVSLLLPVAAYADYTLGAQEVPIIRVIPFAVGSVLISRYVSLEMESKKAELLELWYKGIRKVSLMVVPLTLLCIVIAPDLIAIIAESEGTSYAGAVLPFQIYNMIVLLRVTHYGSILQAFGDTRGVMYLSINLVVANILLSIPLTLWLGITGTALSTLLANFYNWIITLRRIGRHMEVPAYRVLPFGFYLKVLGVGIALAIPVWLSRFQLFADAQAWAGLGWSVTAYLVLFSVFGSLTGVISRRDWGDLRNWLSLRFLSGGGG